MKNFTDLDRTVYILMCILTLGGVFFTKVIIKKAISEMM